jgi:hypothetical protein
MTPLEINILLHYHSSCLDYPDLSPPAHQDAISYCLDAGFLTMTEQHEDMPVNTRLYEPTEKLHVYCDALLHVPEPRQIWAVDPVQPNIQRVNNAR